MITIDWSSQGGWKHPEILPYGPIELQTSATALHYGMSAYMSLGVYENAKTSKIQSFRTMELLDHFLESTTHLDMPAFDTQELCNTIQKFALLEKGWLDGNGLTDHLFLRMNHFSTDKTLGVRSPAETKIIVIATPVVEKKGKKQFSLKCSTDVKKNWPLGHGKFRISGNFGPILPTITDARDNGFDDVLWLLDDYVKEMSN